MDLNLISPPTDELKQPDPEKTEEGINKLETSSLDLENKRFKENTKLRDLLAKIFTLIIALWFVAVILILIGNNHFHYNLSENVLIALLVTTSANVIGMMLIILKNLFPTVEKKDTPTP